MTSQVCAQKIADKNHPDDRIIQHFSGTGNVENDKKFGMKPSLSEGNTVIVDLSVIKNPEVSVI